MATMIHHNGDEDVLEVPDKGRLKFYQECVGGLIQVIPLHPSGADMMLVNEEGLIASLPVNRRATQIVAEKAPQYLFPGAYIAGDVILVDSTEFQ